MPRLVRTAAVFYGIVLIVAVLWSGLRGRDLQLLGDSVPLGVGLGLLSAASTVPMGLLLYKLLPVVREVSEELAPLLVDGASRGSLISLSIFSGVGEEVFFRGAVQPEFGLVVAAVLFGVLHVGPDRRYLFWPVWAIFAGLLFGGLYAVTGGLLAPILAHTLHNAGTLLLWKRSRKATSRP